MVRAVILQFSQDFQGFTGRTGWTLKHCQQEHKDARENGTAYCLTPAGTQLKGGRLLPEWQDLGARQMRLLTACSVAVRGAWLQIRVIYFEYSLALLALFSLHWEVRMKAFLQKGCDSEWLLECGICPVLTSALSILHPAHLLLPSCRNIQAKSMKHCSSLFSVWKSVFSSWRNNCW